MSVVGKYTITVDLPTAKEHVEVAGLGVFENRKTTELTDEQVHRWFNRTGANPLVDFPEGITIKEVTAKAPPPADKKEEAPPKADKPPASDKQKGDA